MPTKKQVSNHEQELEAFLNSTKGGAGAFGFAEGMTGFFPIFEKGLSPVSAFGKTVKFWKGEPRDRWVFYALVMVVEDKENMPDNNTATLIPINVPKTLAHKIAKKLTSDEFRDASNFTELDETGALVYGPMFVVERITANKKTDYEVSVATKLPQDMPERVDVPVLSIQEYGDEYAVNGELRNNEWLAENNTPAAEDGQIKPLNDVAGFM